MSQSHVNQCQDPPGFWHGLYIRGDAAGENDNALDYVTIKYAGGEPWYADLPESAANLTLTGLVESTRLRRLAHSTLSHSAGSGLFMISEVAIDQFNDNTFNRGNRTARPTRLRRPG